MLELRPMTYEVAARYVDEHHRHHKRPVGHKFSIAAFDGERLCGVAMVGRPVSRYLDDGLTLEVNRLCTDGTKNACSLLYAAAWRAAKALGYKRLVTYTLKSEAGASLRAAGWHCDGEAGGLKWSGERAHQETLWPEEKKIRWSKEAAGR
nr:MAG TPA: glyphosate N-acetyltransferase [Caudoviricetes sp.]